MKKVAVIGIAGNSVFMQVEHFHTGGETVEASDMSFEPGGKGYNQAIAASKAGAEVSFLAAVGDDCPEYIYTELTKNGVKPVIIKKSGHTAFASIITDKDGNNRVTVHQGVQLSLSDVAAFEKHILDADVLLLNNEVSQEINGLAADIAYKAGKTVILNPAPVRKLPKDFLFKITYFTPNEHEGDGLENCVNVVQTLGEKGCFIKSSGTILPPIDVKAVDTTGAGDTFNGYFAALLSEGADITTSARYAVAASGISVTRRGACSSIPTRDEAEAYHRAFPRKTEK